MFFATIGAKMASREFSAAASLEERCTAGAHIDAKLGRIGERSDLATEQSLNNSLPNTREQQVLTRATGTKNPRAQPPALCC
jgi:hypothetical protein